MIPAALPAGGIVDSQPAKTTKKGASGYDGTKRLNGGKRHLLLDTGGLVFRVVVHPSSVYDRDAARLLLADAP